MKVYTNVGEPHTRDAFYVRRGRFNENGESKCMHHAYIWKD